jgi:hypothetical protein
LAIGLVRFNRCLKKRPTEGQNRFELGVKDYASPKKKEYPNEKIQNSPQRFA